MTQMPRPFWMVYGAGRAAPTVRHKDIETAMNEAKRLARMLPDTEFFVLAPVAHVVKRDVEITVMPGVEIDPSTFDEIPF